MSESDDSDKTEDPSSRKLEEARSKGQIPQSKEIAHWFMMLAAAILVVMMPIVGIRIYNATIGFWEHPEEYQLDSAQLGDLLQQTVGSVILAMALPFSLLVIAAILPYLIQSGIIFAPDQLGFKLERISPFKGFGRIFSMRSAVELLKGIAKIIIVGAIAAVVLMAAFQEAPQFVTLDMYDLLAKMQSLTAKLLLAMVSIITVIAVIDWLYQRLSFMKDMRMSRQEVKDEYRQSEGDPMVKQRLKQLRSDRARKRMMANVPKSTVVVTNPTHYAIALKYDIDAMEAPRVVAKGVDSLALRIRQVADENEVPILENPPLARALFDTVEIDEEIPAEYYKAVAEIISFVFKMKKAYKPTKR
jgi:flagellar biosynthetic protein FlhB